MNNSLGVLAKNTPDNPRFDFQIPKITKKELQITL